MGGHFKPRDPNINIMKISNSIKAVLLISVMIITTEAKPFYLLGATGVIPAIMLQGGTATTLSLAGAKTLGALALSGALNSEDIPQPSYGGSGSSFKSFKSRLSKRPIKTFVKQQRQRYRHHQ